MHEYGNLPLVGRVIKALLIVLPSALVLIVSSILIVAVLRAFGIRYNKPEKRAYVLLGFVLAAAIIATANAYGGGDVKTLYGSLILTLVMPIILTTAYARWSFLKVCFVCIASLGVSFFLSAKVVFLVEDCWKYGGYPSFLLNHIVGRLP